MNKKDVSALISYNFWANHRVLKTCERISASAFVREVAPDPGWGSLRGILVHMLDTEYGWRSVLQSQEGSEILAANDFADVATLSTRWSVEEAKWFEYLAELHEETLNTPIGAGGPGKPKVWQTIVHVVNHGTQHRSETAAILTGQGQSPGELDFDLFLSENPQ